jgi:hypothetical protein
MILQTGLPKQIETIITLARATTLEKPITILSVDDMKHGYRTFLQSLGQRNVDVTALNPSFTIRQEDTKRLRAPFSNDSLLDDKAQADVICERQDHEALEKIDRITSALKELSLYSSDYAIFLSTIVTDIFVLPSNIARGGSTSQAIGVIWANPKISYTFADLIEMLVHEFTHQAMFLDELRYTHFSYEDVLDRSTWAESAILKVARPLDKVLHSIVVALEILLFRETYVGHPTASRVHPPTNVLISQLKNSISSAEQSIFRDPKVFHMRAKELLQRATDISNEKFGALLAG